MKIRSLLFAVALIPSGVAAQQGFSCSYGDRGACLGYGETVCSSSGKCVSSDAQCFSSYQCDYEGFTCKSNVTDLAEEYDGLQIRFNSLVGDYNVLLEDSREMRAAFQRTISDLEETQDALTSTRQELEETEAELEDTQRDLRRSEMALTDIVICVEGLGRLSDPSTCLP